jgi:mono/diheme cytochrome c family protein
MPFTDTIKPGGQTGAGVVNLIVANLIMAIVVAATCLAAAAASATTPDNTEPATPGDDAAFFTDRVLPIFRERCFDCHSHDGEINGGLALDVASGWRHGGKTGPAIVPGKPEESLLIAAVRHTKRDYEMPPDGDRLPAEEIATLVEWVRRGAADPRTTTAADAWEKLYAERLGWWSLQPVTRPPVPAVRDPAWPRTDIDCFILAKLEAEGLQPAPEAEAHTLARRLALVLTGLPPDPEITAGFVADPSAAAYDRLVESLLASPHYGEHQARHWMDVVHYADTHGYEWDVPAKNAWMYRDYLVRAFNADVPFDRLVMEQIAGDMIEPRVDPAIGINESIIGPMALRMGERRHGDSAGYGGVTEENLADMIDTTSKAFLATTVGCARCHDHKLDAVAQADYYAIGGVFLSTRWSVRCVDQTDPNVAVIDELRDVKRSLKDAIVARWRQSRPAIVERLRRVAVDEKATAFPESLAAVLRRPDDPSIFAAEFTTEREQRIAHNRTHLKLIADFTVADPKAAGGWQWEGFGMKHGLVADGELVVPDEGDAAVLHLLPAGRWSHAWSMRLAGAIRSPELFARPPRTLSVGYGGGHKASNALLIDRAFHTERLGNADRPPGSFLTFTAGNFERLVGPPDTADRRVSLELVTKALDNNFPPRKGLGGVSPADEHNPRSFFGVTRVYEHPAGQPPLDELGRLEPLFAAGDADAAAGAGDRDRLLDQVAARILTAVDRWAAGSADAEDVLVINEALREKWLDSKALDDPAVATLVARYREAEKRLWPDRTIGSMAEWFEGRDARLAIRGSETDLGAEVPRGTVRFLRDSAATPPSAGSGRLELAGGIASPRNPLTARVYVNRVWLHCFGEGLVRTPDDFGHLGEPPVHGALLDHLAGRFIDEGWSTKKLIREIVSSAAWKMASSARPENVAADPENRLWHHHPRRRLEAEPLRDSMLAVAGRLDRTLGGPPIDPHRAKEDDQKRLVSGPIDGRGRRSLYIKMTLMEPPRFLALFNQPMPKVTVGKRDRTTVPDQALALLNDPFVTAMAKAWAERVVGGEATSESGRIRTMLEEALGRPARPEEVTRLATLASASAEARGVAGAERPTSVPLWQDVAHAIFLTQEFSHVE